MGHAGVGAITGVHNVCERIMAWEFEPYKVVGYSMASGCSKQHIYGGLPAACTLAQVRWWGPWVMAPIYLQYPGYAQGRNDFSPGDCPNMVVLCLLQPRKMPWIAMHMRCKSSYKAAAWNLQSRVTPSVAPASSTATLASATLVAWQRWPALAPASRCASTWRLLLFRDLSHMQGVW
jgi:hypothetical protein